MLSKVSSAVLLGLECYKVEVEVDISSGVPGFNIVGLAEQAIQEAKERVRSAIKNSNIEFPLRKITINLAPADLRKDSSLLDLPIAIGILSCQFNFNIDSENTAFLGELALDGRVRKGKGLLPLVWGLKNKGFKKVIIPKENEKECSLVKDIDIYPVENINQVINFLMGNLELKPSKFEEIEYNFIFDEDFSIIKGQEVAKRAMEISAAGGHNILLVGPPGTGKTLLAKSLPSILPPLTYEEAFEVTQIYSVAGLLNNEYLIQKRPFRNPHHTISYAGLLGGGSTPQVGEVSLAHRGVLFLDELPEFRRDVLEALRQPLEDGRVIISRSKYTVSYPAQFILVGSMNPCRCGYFGDKDKNCICSPYEVRNYWHKISGPLLDRFDIRIYVGRVEKEKIFQNGKSESSEEIRKRIEIARKIQEERFKKEKIFTNSQMTPKYMKKYCPLSNDAKNFLANIMDKMKLSLRGLDRIIKVSRTIADLERSENIKIDHLAEAVSYRGLEDFIS
ncbi:MAG: YifB family Mg chelatase-like AAA ATPase [Dictyoglomaceae bacterium]|nr:YifB family Mg chelatase-like AAA ATPase [Dictyoglomaceae bacterium]